VLSGPVAFDLESFAKGKCLVSYLKKIGIAGISINDILAKIWTYLTSFATVLFDL